jgi:poly-gamma-glutamate synthesis protein (capsule biosynthesis protein)
MNQETTKLFFLFMLGVFLISFTTYILNFDAKIDSLYLKATIAQPLIKIQKSITLFFVGDIMLDRGVELSVKKYGNNDWKFPFLKISDFLKKADILFGNLEGPISDKGQKVGTIYSFRADPKVIEGLTYAGFDILSVANNHIFDYAESAMADTFSRLKEAGIDYAGGGFNESEAYSPRIKEINGTKFAFLAFTNLCAPFWEATKENPGIACLTANPLDNQSEKEKIKKSIAEGNERADLVIVSMHFGQEYQTSPTPEKRALAQLFIDAGADLVVGHHPHVAQPIEKYKSGYIAYSLGNFVFDQDFSEETMEGLLLKVIVENAKIKEVIPLTIRINKFFQPEIIL